MRAALFRPASALPWALTLLVWVAFPARGQTDEVDDAPTVEPTNDEPNRGLNALSASAGATAGIVLGTAAWLGSAALLDFAAYSVFENWGGPITLALAWLTTPVCVLAASTIGAALALWFSDGIQAHWPTLTMVGPVSTLAGLVIGVGSGLAFLSTTWGFQGVGGGSGGAIAFLAIVIATLVGVPASIVGAATIASVSELFVVPMLDAE
jgi:hypothetical protein